MYIQQRNKVASYAWKPIMNVGKGVTQIGNSAPIFKQHVNST